MLVLKELRQKNLRHSGAGRNPALYAGLCGEKQLISPQTRLKDWIPACAGMTVALEDFAP